MSLPKKTIKIIAALFTVVAFSSDVFAHKITLEDGFNLRSGPGERYRSYRINTRDRQVRLSRYSRDGKWARVTLPNGRAAWVAVEGLTGLNRPPSNNDTNTTTARNSDSQEQDDNENSAPNTLPSEKFGAMRYDPVAAGGSCLVRQVRTDDQAKALLEYYNIRTPGSNSTERINLANGLFQVSALFGGRFEPLSGVTFRFESRRGFSRYLAGQKVVELNRCNKYGNRCGNNSNVNVARLMHEIGHAFGHGSFRGRTSYYDQFAAKIKGCYPTGYSDNNLVENVGEIFSAYVTRPILLSRGSSACKRAYEFLSTEVFKANGTLASCDTAQKQRLMAQIQGFQNTERVASFEGVFNRRGLSSEVTQVASLPESTANQINEASAVREPTSL